MIIVVVRFTEKIFFQRIVSVLNYCAFIETLLSKFRMCLCKHDLLTEISDEIIMNEVS